MSISSILKGFGRRTNPSATDGLQNVAYDDLGRGVTWPFQVRDLHTTAQATLSNGTSTVLKSAGGSGVFLDLVHVTFANQSTVAATVVLLDDGTTRKTIQVPASSTLSIDFTYPLLQNASNSQWNVDMGDITGTTINVDAEFISNV